MEANLGTTNLFLGIIAIVSLLEALVALGVGIAAMILCRRATALIGVLEERHVAPAMLRVNAILDDVKVVSATVRDETERVDDAIRSTIHRVDETATRVRTNVRAKTSRVVGFIRGLRVVLESMLVSRVA